ALFHHMDIRFPFLMHFAKGWHQISPIQLVIKHIQNQHVKMWVTRPYHQWVFTTMIFFAWHQQRRYPSRVIGGGNRFQCRLPTVSYLVPPFQETAHRGAFHSQMQFRWRSIISHITFQKYRTLTRARGALINSLGIGWFIAFNQQPFITLLLGTWPEKSKLVFA